MRAFAFFLLCSVVLPAMGQQKIESEKRISSEQMPEDALKVLEYYLPKVGKLRYFLEKDGNTISYEAKFRYKRKAVSVEFSKNGLLEDIEIIKKYSSLPETFRTAVEQFLSKDCDAFHIVKCQKQYQHIAEDPAETIRQVLNEQWDGPVFYELEADVKKNKNWHSEELLFDDKGRLITRRHIIRRAEDNLLY